MFRYIIAILLIAFSVNAEEILSSFAAPDNETVIYGEANTSDKQATEILIEQPDNVDNPLGTPIIDEKNSSNSAFQKQNPKVLPQLSNTSSPQNDNAVEQSTKQNPSDSQMSTQQMNNEIQNKLYEEGNRIYDLQSYPIDDFDYINKNGQDNAVTDYPAY